MIQYYVVGEKSIVELVTKVNKMMNDGWEPLGGIATRQSHAYSESGIYCQAMTKQI
jgi:hypothetical protein